MDGRLDQVGVWKRVLTADERTWLYNSGNGRSYTEIVAYQAPNINDTATLAEDVTMKMHLQNTAVNDGVALTDATPMHLPIYVQGMKV